MISASARRPMIVCVMAVCLISVLTGCGSMDGGLETSVLRNDLLLQHNALLPSSGSNPAPGGVTVSSVQNSNEPGSPDGPAVPTSTTTTQSAPGSGPSTGQSGPEDAVAPEGPASSGAVTLTGTTPASRHLAERPRNNPEAADLLDHWRQRQSHRLAEGLDLSDSTLGNTDADLRALQTAAQGDNQTVTPDLHDSDEVAVLGIHRGVTYGRWAGGSADTLSIKFDISRAGPEMRGDLEFRAMLERAGKTWSHRIVDTWATWERSTSEHKGWLINGNSPEIEVRVGEDGETSTGLEINIVDADLPEEVAGLANTGAQPSDDTWEPRFGSIEIDRTHLQEADEAALFATLAHEVGHVLGAWMGDLDGYESYIDTAAGTWTGPNVVAVHGGPAPFQDASDTHAWVDGERDPSALEYDFRHSGVCASLLSYCRFSAALPTFLPHAIDFAFLSDLGVTVIDETDRPETYGLAGWTDYAAFTLSLSRELEIALADPQPHYDGAVNPWQELDAVDLLQIRVDVFGHRTTAAHAANLSGTARYAGGLIGAALDRTGLPPVTGDASLALNLGTLDGMASFTSLLVYPEGIPEIFASGALYYPFGLTDNAIVGTGAGLTLRADFYGPGHKEVAGVLHDPRAGLLASFGTTADDRPSREAVIADADYMAGTSYQQGSADPTNDGWYQYRCETDASCESHHARPSESWGDWTATTREVVLASTAGWDWRDTSRPTADGGFVRIARQTSTSTDGARGRHAVDGYMGTLEHTAFGVGFEGYTSEWTDSIGTAAGFGTTWAGFQGALSGSRPSGLARWSGPMLGYQGGHDAGDNPFVEGLATVTFSLSDNQVDVLISEVMSRDHQRVVADFGFEDLAAAADGRFEGFRSGSIEGAFFGPSHEETAGSFHHNATHVTGSFGGRRLPDTVSLEESGAFRLLESTEGSGFYTYDDWGFWARQFEENVFGAFIEQTTRTVGQTTYYDSTQGRIDGTTSGSNPVSGTAVWSGKVRAFDTQSEARWTPVSGNARLEVDIGDATVDIDFTDFEGGHSDMSWDSLGIQGGAFSHIQGGATLEGAFYGSEHQGAVGTFRRDRLDGVFGAVRN